MISRIETINGTVRSIAGVVGLPEGKREEGPCRGESNGKHHTAKHNYQYQCNNTNHIAVFYPSLDRTGCIL